MQPTVSFLPLGLWLGALALSVALASAQLLRTKPLFLHWHSRLAAIAALAALAQLALPQAAHSWPLSSGPIAWLLISLVLGLGTIVQRFSLRFLHGDLDQARALAWLTLLTSGTSLAWASTDSRLLLLGWGLALWALFRLIGLARDWPAAQAAARYVGLWLSVAWLALLVLVVLVQQQTGHWQVGLPTSLASWPAWAIQTAAAALLLAALIPAAQWPAQRWLLATMVAPTPVSAIMHAGLVNAGGILLLHYGSLLAAAGWAQVSLLLLAVCSILLGSGMALVQVDVKRQLAASTVAQMGCMLLQCALGAYLAALIHLLLHGLFKASLFLQAGGTVSPERRAISLPAFPKVLLLAALVMIGLFALHPAYAAQPAGWLSALLLAWALAQGLATLPIWQWRSLPFWLVSVGGFFAVQAGLHALLPAPAALSALANGWIYLSAALLLGGSAALQYLLQRPRHPLAQRLYWQLISLSEAPRHTLDMHPNHLARRAQQGVLV
ncbi:proton-conducting transporter membrane subunit [Chitinibacter sp. ZOR0017]|uniref:proton-conducting transporter transmembrane domain-containing protein n=1 Tax=Chitinibacter sp. ZOR0017 TaxID=1339254 RepID=UPI000646E8A4|nr:proton-conducting transporter membrane subunit [Chitinibacter sp. ZOR0017]